MTVIAVDRNHANHDAKDRVDTFHYPSRMIREGGQRSYEGPARGVGNKDYTSRETSLLDCVPISPQSCFTNLGGESGLTPGSSSMQGNVENTLRVTCFSETPNRGMLRGQDEIRQDRAVAARKGIPGVQNPRAVRYRLPIVGFEGKQSQLDGHGKTISAQCALTGPCTGPLGSAPVLP